MTEFYLDARQKKKGRRLLRLKIYGGLAVFLLLIIGALYVIIYSPLFQIKNITILGTSDVHNIDELKIFFISQSKISSFLGEDNLLIWDIKKLGQFQKNPEIASLIIEKDYSGREIKIKIKERQRFGAWCFGAQTNADITQTDADFQRDSASSQRKSAEQCSWFDENGVLFSSAPLMEGNLVNKVDDLSGRPLKAGDLVLEQRLIPNLVKIFGVLEKSDLGIKSLKLEKLELQEISTNSSPIIYFSLRIDPNFALAVFKSLKSDNLDKVEYIDLRVENRAYYKPK